MHKFSTPVLIAALVILVGSCCSPKLKSSYPLVIDSTYSYIAIKDADIALPPDYILDSMYYPVYAMNIQNIGSEADSFTLVIDRDGIYPLTVTQYLHPGEVKTFRTYGQIPSDMPDSAKLRYYSFYVSTPDSLNLSVLRPSVTVYYGNSITGPESCGSPAVGLPVSIDSLGK